MPDAPDDKPIDRRRFFRHGLRELLKPLVKTIDPIEQTARQLGAMHTPTEVASVPTAPCVRSVPLKLWLRPPGAIKEKDFLTTCSRCGDCVRACPVQCIKLDPTSKEGTGVPFIDADLAACAVCTSLACMNVCATGALVPVPMLDIDMGTAVWKQHTCTRETKGDDCTLCVDACPLGSAAIELVSGNITVHPLTCIGCGECQQACPTDPKSMIVIPKSAREP